MEEYTKDTNVMDDENDNKCINACRNVMKKHMQLEKSLMDNEN